MRWEGRKVLVTGSGGFIGSHLTEELVRLGAEVRALVRYNSSGSAGWLDGSPVRKEFQVVWGDVRDPDTFAKGIAGAETVFHLAALIGIPYSYRAVRSYVDTNLVGTLNAMQAAIRAGVSCFVHTSTSEVYGSAQYIPIDESHPLRAQSPYSASKIAADKLAESFHLAFRLPVVIARPFNTFGPRQSSRAVIPTIIEQALHGTEIRLGNLEPRRDLTHVSDTVQGFIRLSETPDAVGRTINLGSGTDISIGELVVALLEILGVEKRVTADAERVRPEGSEVDRLRADNGLAIRLTGWEPRVELRDGLSSTVEWYRDRKGRDEFERYVV